MGANCYTLRSSLIGSFTRVGQKATRETGHSLNRLPCLPLQLVAPTDNSSRAAELPLIGTHLPESITEQCCLDRGDFGHRLSEQVKVQIQKV